MFNLLIPTDSKKRFETRITTLDQKPKWCFIKLENGKIDTLKFFDNKEDIEEWIDCVVVENETEYVWPFIEENITVLVAPVQKSIDEIVEAFLFKELHDLNY